MGCIVKHDGKEYTIGEFAEFLSKGELRDRIADGTVKGKWVDKSLFNYDTKNIEQSVQGSESQRKESGNLQDKRGSKEEIAASGDVQTHEKEIVPDRKAEVAQKRASIQKDLDSLFGEFKKSTGGKLSMGVNPDQLAIAAKIIAKYTELGITNLKEIAIDLKEQLGDRYKELERAINKAHKNYEKDIKDTKSSIVKIKKSISKKDKKGKFTNVSEKIAELSSLPLHKIENDGLRKEVLDVLKDLDNSNVSRYTKDQVQSLIDRVNKDIKEPSPAKIKDSKELKKSTNKIGENISSLSEMAIQKEGRAKSDIRSFKSKAYGISKSLENAKESIEASFLDGKINEAEYKSAMDEISKHEAAFEKAVKDFGADFETYVKDTFDSGKKKIASSQDVSWMTKAQKELYDSFRRAVAALKSTDKLWVAEDVFNIANDIENGYIPIHEMNKIISAVHFETKGSPAIETLTSKIEAGTESVKKANMLQRWLMNRFSRTGTISSLPEAIKKLRSREWAFHDNLFSAKREGVLNLLREGIERGESEFTDSISALADSMLKILNVSLKDLTSLSRITEKRKINTWFKDNLDNNPILYKVGMLMSEMRWADKYGESYWKDVLDSESSRKSIDKSELKKIQKAFDSLPKDSNGNIDISKTEKSLTATEKKMLDFARDAFSDMRQKEEISAARNGIKFEGESNYFPWLRQERKGAKTEELSDVARIERPLKWASDRQKQQTSKEKEMIEVNLAKALFNAGRNTYRDYYLSQPYRDTARVFNEMSKSNNPDVAMWGRALASDLRHSVKGAFEPVTSGWVKSLTSSSYSYFLTTLNRLPVELTVEALRTAGSETNPLSSLSREALTKQLHSSMKSLVGGESSAMNKLMNFTDSPFRLRFNRMKEIGSFRDTGRESKGLVSKIGDMPTKYTIGFEWMPKFAIEYLKKTGERFDFDKVNDPAYLEKNRDAIFEAAAKADASTSLVKGSSSRIAQRTLYQYMPGFVINVVKNVTGSKNFGYFDAIKDPNAAKLNAWMTNFMNREWLKLNEDFADIATQDNSDRAEAIRNVSVQYTSGVLYGMMATTSWALLNSLWASDDDKEFYYNIVKDTWTPEGFAKYAKMNYISMASSKYGQLLQKVSLIGIGMRRDVLVKEMNASHNASEKEELQKQIDAINNETRALFYTYPISFAKGQSIGGGKTLVGAGGTAPDIIKTILPQATTQVELIQMSQELMAAASDEDLTDEERTILASTAFRMTVIANARRIPFSKNIDSWLKATEKELKPKKKTGGVAY